jgi:hypothetical protein
MIGKKTIMFPGGFASPVHAGVSLTASHRAEVGRPPRLVGPLAVVVAPALTGLVLWNERLGLIACVGILLPLAALVRPATGLAALIPLSQLQAATGDGTSHTFAATVLVAAAAALAAALLAGVNGAHPIRPAHPWIMLLVGTLFISVRFPAIDAPASATTDFVELLAGLVLLAAVAAVAPRPRTIVWILTCSGGLAAGYALALGAYDNGRLQAFGLNPNYLGAMLALPCVAAVGMARLRRNPIWLVPAATCLTAIVGTQSRGAFLSAAAGIVVVVLQGHAGRSRTRAALAACAAGLAIALAGPAGGLGMVEHVAAGNRQSDELAYDTDVRGKAAEFAMTVAARHPVRGIGYGDFPSYAAAAPDFGIYMATHDDYLRLAAEAGGGALGAFLVLLWLGARGRRHGDLAVARAVTVAYAVGLVFANPLANLLVSLPFWLSLGCLLAVRPAGERRHGK